MDSQPKTARMPINQPLEERLAQHPELRTKIESLLLVIENAKGDLNRADDAEQAVLEEIRGIGQTALGEWAQSTQEAAQKSFLQDHPKAHRSRKKNSTGTVD